MSADGTALTGQEILAAMPASVRNSEVNNQAVGNVLLARGADLSDAAILNYYAANPSLFLVDCVSDIATATEAQANQVMTKLAAGQSFSDLAEVVVDRPTDGVRRGLAGLRLHPVPGLVGSAAHLGDPRTAGHPDPGVQRGPG